MSSAESWGAVGLVVVVLAVPGAEDGRAGKRSPRRALQPFTDLIGSWRGTGEPYGSRQERLKGFWQEKIAWQWQFKGPDVWLAATMHKGKHFSAAELRYLPGCDVYQLKVSTLGKETLTFEGRLSGKHLWRLGCTKEGVAFAGPDARPHYVVSGGLGTLPVMYKGGRTTFAVRAAGMPSPRSRNGG